MADRVGQQFGNYRLIRLLGEGGFAEVYLAEHLHLGTQAAIKVLHTQLASDDLEKFRAEGRTLAHLIHPHIVRVLDFGIEDKTPFLVMDYAQSGTLRRRHAKGALLPLHTVAGYVKQVASALQYAHGERVIHRDVKPENMLLGRHNEVLLSDFGIAVIAHNSRSQSTQDITGTIAYMAPEHIQGKPRPASDQYSLGVVVYEWLSGDRPFHGSFTELCTQHLFAPPPPLREKVPTISPGTERIVQIALAKDPHQRFASVQAFATALEQESRLETLEYPRSTIVPPASPTPPAPEPFRSYRPNPYVSEYSNTPTFTSETGLPTRNREELFASEPKIDTANVTLRRRPSRIRIALLMGLALLVIAGGTGFFYLLTTNQKAVGGANATATSRAHEMAIATAQVVATATTPEQMYASITSGTPVLDDPLSDNSKGYNWYEGTVTVRATHIGMCTFTGGAFHATAEAGYFDNCDPTAFSPFHDFAFQVQMTIIKGDAGGMEFRINLTGDYVFVIGQDGSYKLSRYEFGSNTLTTLQSGSSSTIKTGLNQSNLIAVLAHGNTIDLYVNRHYVTRAVNSTYSAGYIGVCAFSAGNLTEVAFRNAKAWTF